jgi:hypothetical protein
MWATGRDGKPVFSALGAPGANLGAKGTGKDTTGTQASVDPEGIDLKDLQERPSKLASPPPHVCWVEVQINLQAETITKDGGSEFEFMVTFGLSADKGGPHRVVRKRHADFLRLHAALCQYYPQIKVRVIQ